VIFPSRMKSISRPLAWAGAFAFGGFAALANGAVPAPTQAGTETQQAQTIVSPKEVPRVPITVLEDTLVRVRTIEPVSSKRAKRGALVLFTVSEDVFVGDALAIPRGATVHGTVIESKKPGRLTGSPDLTLELISLDLGGRYYPLYTHPFTVRGMSKTKPTEIKTIRGAAVGAIVGNSISGVSKTGPVTEDGTGKAASMAAGASIGAGVGSMVSAATPGPEIRIPSESQLDFFLAAPITVTPVSAKEAARMAEGLHPGGPMLYVRGESR